jgi:hypothetical protein
VTERDEFVLLPFLRVIILVGSGLTMVVFSVIAVTSFSRGEEGRGLLALALTVTGFLGVAAPWSLGRRGGWPMGDRRRRRRG